MRLGRATIEGVLGEPTVKEPVVPQWVPFDKDLWGPASDFIRPSWAHGLPLINIQSGLGPEGYTRMLAGEFDDRFAELKRDLRHYPTAMVRWDWEFDGNPLDWRPWSGMDPALYIEGFRYASLGFDRPLFWCGTSVFERWHPYFPGRRWVSHIGWDQYSRLTTRPLNVTWPKRIREAQRIAGKGIPVVVGEFGSLVSLPERDRIKQLRTILKVDDLYAAAYFDINMAGDGDDWRMTPEMLTEWRRIIRGTSL